MPSTLTGLCSGAQSLSLYNVTGSSSLTTVGAIVDQINNIGLKPLVPAKEVSICFASGSTKQSGRIDIGSGQGQFAIAYRQAHPEVDVWGVEYSAAGVRRSREEATRLGVTARFIERDLLGAVSLEPDQPRATHARSARHGLHCMDDGNTRPPRVECPRVGLRQTG